MIVRMSEHRGQVELPDDLESMPPGPALLSLLASVDRWCLSGRDRLRLVQARNRLSAHVQGELFADLYAVSLDDEPDEESMRPEAPSRYRWATSEVAFALTWTETAAGARLERARQLVEDLPEVFASLRSGRIDMPKVLVVCELASWLEDRSQARRVVEAVIDKAPGLTTGQLRAKLRRLVLAVDPAAARRRCARALRLRRVESFPNPDGTGEVWGRSLPPQDAAAAWERLTAIARAAKSAGDDRTLDQLRADVLLDLLVGEGVAVGEPVTRHLAGLPEADGHPYDDVPGGPPRPGPVHAGPVHAGPAETSRPAEPRPDDPPGPDTGRRRHRAAVGVEAAGPESGPPHRDGPCQPSTGRREGSPAGLTPGGAALPAPRRGVAALPAPRRGVVELLLPVSTATGLDDLPGELAGWGPVLADIARQISEQQRDGQWRFSAYGRLGELEHHGITTARPARPGRQGSGRRPAAAVAAFVKARNRTCTAPGCRVPATSCDLDHTTDWSKGGGSDPDNLGPSCRRHHRFKHESGATLWQLDPGGVFVWTTRSGMQYLTRPDPPQLHDGALTRAAPAPADTS